MASLAHNESVQDSSEPIPATTKRRLVGQATRRHFSHRERTQRSNMWRFSRSSIAHLTPYDQLRFEQFGQGPLVKVPQIRIHQAFEAQARTRPGALAASDLGAAARGLLPHRTNNAITYGELERQANRLARVLESHGVQPGDNVALFLQRSVPMLVGILAVLKTGAAYVPQHVGVAPAQQLRYIIDAASTRVILTLSSLQQQIPVPDGHICIAIDEVMQESIRPGSEQAFQPQRTIQREDRCFILFTSGTTGPPNGVQVTHGNICNILLTNPGNLGMRPGLRVAQILSIAFDMAAWEILGCLAHGATLVMRGQDFMQAARQVDILISTPSILGSLDASLCQNVRVVAVAGEPCPRPLADKWAAFCTFYNSCGPTETTIVNTMQRHRIESSHLTIGKPTPNNTVYILDAQMRPCPIGEIGEMWAGGDCVSAGYLHNAALNAERYAPDPFLGQGRLMFRTRDLGRWTPDGELEHFGRTDDQVKIRGFRVELDSVTTVLESTPACAQAVTLKWDDRHLIAFVRPQSVDIDAAKAQVAAALPYYCVPAHLFALNAFPTTSRGKLDKRVLLQYAHDRLDRASCNGERAEMPRPVRADHNAAPLEVA